MDQTPRHQALFMDPFHVSRFWVTRQRMVRKVPPLKGIVFVALASAVPVAICLARRPRSAGQKSSPSSRRLGRKQQLALRYLSPAGTRPLSRAPD